MRTGWPPPVPSWPVQSPLSNDGLLPERDRGSPSPMASLKRSRRTPEQPLHSRILRRAPPPSGLGVAFLFVLLYYRPRRHFCGPLAIATGPFSALLDVFILHCSLALTPRKCFLPRIDLFLSSGMVGRVWG